MRGLARAQGSEFRVQSFGYSLWYNRTMSSPLVALATIGAGGIATAANIIGSKAQQEQIRAKVREAEEQQRMLTASMVHQSPAPIKSTGIIIGVVVGMAVALGAVGFILFKASAGSKK